MLTATRLRELFYYDPTKGHFTRLVTTSSNAIKGMRAGSLNPDGYRRIKIDRALYREHRLAWLYQTGEWPPCAIDHKDQNPSNNRWANLRLCPTHSLQMANRGAWNKLGLKGVYQASTGKYKAKIRVAGRCRELGTFLTPHEAGEAYRVVAIAAFGDFACA
jgi:hypothetical protein